jgi:hypothetical protein
MGTKMVNNMELAIFENDTGEGVVSFEPWQTSGPDYDKDHSRWYCHLTIAGERVFEYGCPCGTCGIVFRKIGSAAYRLSDTKAVELLGNLDAMPSHEALRKLARVLKPGLYCPSIVTGSVKLIEPGASDDYFSTDVVRLFGLEPPDYTEPAGPRTSYYRLGVDRQLERTGRISGPHKALVTAVVMPLHEPSELNRERIEYWKRQHHAGMNLTAFAVSVLDNQAPAMSPPDNTYPYEEQFLLTMCLLDGHHRIQAAAELGVPVHILSLLAREFSLVRNSNDIATVLRGYSP